MSWAAIERCMKAQHTDYLVQEPWRERGATHLPHSLRGFPQPGEPVPNLVLWNGDTHQLVLLLKED